MARPGCSSLSASFWPIQRWGRRLRRSRPTDCEEVLERFLDNLQVMIEESRAVVTHDPLPTVTADGELLVQVLQNLIGNAVKFKGPDDASVHIHADRRDDEWVF